MISATSGWKNEKQILQTESIIEGALYVRPFEWNPSMIIDNALKIVWSGNKNT